MPHCILEYSDNIADPVDIRDLFRQLHEVLVGTGQFTLADIKSRAIRHEVYLIADGDPDRVFITMNLAILTGRSDEVKAHMARAVRELLERSFPRTLADKKCSLTVQVSELHRPSYQKVLSKGF
jgi:5-carboxymethyl-2-hydroxymuconate isomerase